MKDPVSREPANRASLFAFANLVTLIMSFYNRQLQVILQVYLSGNLSPFPEVYLSLKFTVSGQFVLAVCAFHGYAFGVVLFIFRLDQFHTVNIIFHSQFHPLISRRESFHQSFTA